jgi:ABC-type bacteriocin/lantibiotic exporter with double-glycine peptidase domain
LRGDPIPTDGRVLIDNIATSDKAFANVSPSVAYVGPRPVTFRGTILENITSFQPHTRNFARTMAMLIGLEDSVNELPNGYDTKVGDGIADGLPVSLMQQMSIVRALSSAPRVLLLDSVDAVLDRRADTALIRAIDKLRGNLTLIIGTYRPSVLAKCDAIFRLTDDGQLIKSHTAPPVEPARGVA